MSSSPFKARSRPVRRATARDIEKLRQNRGTSIFNPIISKGLQERRAARIATRGGTLATSNVYHTEGAGDAPQNYDMIEMNEEYDENDTPASISSSQGANSQFKAGRSPAQADGQEALAAILFFTPSMYHSDEEMGVEGPETSDAESMCTDGRNAPADSDDDNDDSYGQTTSHPTIDQEIFENVQSEHGEYEHDTGLSYSQPTVKNTSKKRAGTEGEAGAGADETFIMNILGMGDPSAYYDEEDEQSRPSFYRKSIISSTPSTPGNSPSASTTDLSWALEAVQAAYRSNLI